MKTIVQKYYTCILLWLVKTLYYSSGFQTRCRGYSLGVPRYFEDNNNNILITHSVIKYNFVNQTYGEKI